VSDLPERFRASVICVDASRHVTEEMWREVKVSVNTFLEGLYNRHSIHVRFFGRTISAHAGQYLHVLLTIPGA